MASRNKRGLHDIIEDIQARPGRPAHDGRTAVRFGPGANVAACIVADFGAGIAADELAPDVNADIKARVDADIRLDHPAIRG